MMGMRKFVNYYFFEYKYAASKRLNNMVKEILNDILRIHKIEYFELFMNKFPYQIHQLDLVMKNSKNYAFSDVFGFNVRDVY
jgi:protein-arginine kinase